MRYLKFATIGFIIAEIFPMFALGLIFIDETHAKITVDELIPIIYMLGFLGTVSGVWTAFVFRKQ